MVEVYTGLGEGRQYTPSNSLVIHGFTYQKPVILAI
jgi:hypothetical protein